MGDCGRSGPTFPHDGHRLELRDSCRELLWSSLHHSWAPTLLLSPVGGNTLGWTIEATVRAWKGQVCQEPRALWSPHPQVPTSPDHRQWVGMGGWRMPASGPGWSRRVSHDDTPRARLLFPGCLCPPPHHAIQLTFHPTRSLSSCVDHTLH